MSTIITDSISPIHDTRSLPRISIVTPSYNQGKYLEKTILSVLEQGYPNLEYIIIDGGSTDESVEIIKKYADRLTYWVSEPDRGQSHAINKGFERATGEIFGWLNSDDWYHPGALQAVADAFVANPEAGAVVGAGDFFFEETDHFMLIEPFPVSVESLYGAVDRFFMQPSCFFTRSAWLSSGSLDEKLQLAMDLDLWLRIAKKFQFVEIDQNLSTSLVHKSAKTTAFASQSLVDACLVIMRHGGIKEGRERLVKFLLELYDKRNELNKAYENISSLSTENEKLKLELVHNESQLEDAKRKLAERDARIHALQNSLSWRITKPLRSIHEKLLPIKHSKQQKPPVNLYINKYFSLLLHRDRTETIQFRDVTVDIVLPVYNGFDVTKACVESVLKNSENCRLIMIDDASTDERISEFLKSITGNFEKNIDVIYVRNEENVGFVRSVNKAFKLTKHHFVILNSDTEVPPGWLDRLIAPIIRYKNIATVTPFSNSATICSFPETGKDNALFRRLAVATLDSYFNRYGSPEPIDIPTGVGFCMAINKQLTERIGLFDEETFSRGYGEENDFCMRAAKAGYRNVLVSNLFVYHKHGESFGNAEKQKLLTENYQKLVKKHPEYPKCVDVFVNADPARDVRDTLSLIIAASEGEKNKTIALIDFDLGGGANVYTTNLAQQLTDAGHRVVHLKYNLLRRCLNVECTDTEPVKLSLPEEETAHIGRILSLLAVEFVMVSQLVSWPEPSKVMSDIKGSGIPYLIFMHDFFYICPNWYLLKRDCQFCNMPADKNICAQCLQQDELFNIPITYEPRMRDVEAWRDNVASFLSGASRVVCFSDSTIALVRKAYPTLDNLELNEHSIPQQQLFKWRSRSFNGESALTVAVIGCINFAKGGKLLEQLAASKEFAEMPVRVVVIGTMQPMPSAELLLNDKLIIHGDYSRGELPGLLEHYGVSAVMIPSIWPETFSYTTSEAMLLGYPVLCFDIGAPAERVRRYNCGVVLDESSVDGMLKALRTILARPAIVEEMSKRTGEYVPNTPEKHFATLIQIVNSGTTVRQIA